jgi:hypothetical protein
MGMRINMEYRLYFPGNESKLERKRTSILDQQKDRRELLLFAPRTVLSLQGFDISQNSPTTSISVEQIERLLEFCNLFF